MPDSPPPAFSPSRFLRLAGRKTRVKHPSSSSERHVLAPPQPTSHRPPTTPSSRGGGAISPLFSFGSDSSLSSPPDQLRPLKSPSDEAPLGVGGKGARPLLARGRSFFGPGSGGTAHMFASSPRGARAAARRARSFQAHGSTSSVWASEVDGPKREDSIAKSLENSGVVEKAGSAGGMNSSDGGAGVGVGATKAGAGTAAGSGLVTEKAADGGVGTGAAGFEGGSRVGSSAPSRELSSRQLGVERSSSSGSLVNGHRLPVPLSYVPPAPTPPLLSGAGSSSRPGGTGGSVAGAIDVSFSGSSDVVSSSGTGDVRTGGSGELWARSPPPSSRDLDLAGRKKAATVVVGRGLAPNLALAIAGLRSVSPEDRGDSGVAAGAAGGKGSEGGDVFGRSSLRSNSNSNSSSMGSNGSIRRPSEKGQRSRVTPESEPVSVTSEVSGDSSGNGGRARRTIRELEERRAALIAASVRTSAEPPPPPPRLLSKAKSEASGINGGGLTRPTPKKPLARSKTTVAETTTSSRPSPPAASGFSANRQQGNGIFDDAPSVVSRLRPEMRARQPRKQQQQQQHAPPDPVTAAAATTAATAKNEDKLLVKFPVSASLSPSLISVSTPPVQHRLLSGGATVAVTTAGGEKSPAAAVAPSPASSSAGSSWKPVGAASDSPFTRQPPSRPSGKSQHMPSAASLALGGGSSPARSDGNGSVRSLVPGPRLVPATRFEAEPPTTEQDEAVAGEAEPNKVGVGGGGDDTRRAMRAEGYSDRPLGGRGAMDDLPPAEMGALGVSLVCAMCGTAERKKSSGGVGARKEAEADAEVEVTRCSRCRKGCCEACYKHLPVLDRESKVVVPGEPFFFVLVEWL